MKKWLLLCAMLAASATMAGATEWYGYYYEFPDFKYRALQLLGSDATVPDMFPVAVQLNDYVCELQRNGKLEEKPVVYDIYTTVEPVVMRDRLVVVHRDRFSVFERDKCIKSLPAPDIFWTGQTLRNDNSNIKIHSDRLNIHYSESLVDFSYSYSRNRLYRTD